MVAGMSFEGGEGILPDAYRAAQNLIRFNLTMPPYAPPWPRPPEPTGPGSGLSGWRPPIPPKPKEIPPWETLPQVTNPPSYTSRSEPPLDAQIDRQILMRETRLRELRATNAKFGAAMKGIAQRDQVWMAIMRQAARDSEWAMVGATRSCVDLLCSTMGPLRALADELRVGSATLPKYQGSVGKGAEYVHSLVEKLSVGLESPALKEGLKGLDKALRETVLAIDIGIGSGQGAEVADRVEELEPWISRVLGAVDEEQNGERKGALMFVAQAGTDIGADVVKDYFMNRLAALGRVTPV